MPFPFDAPTLSRGYAALTPAARQTGARAMAAAAEALATVVGRAISIHARPVPGVAAPRAAAAPLALELGALPARAVLEVEPALVVAILDALVGGNEPVAPATVLTPVEASALDLLALVALDGACSVAEVEASLAPRLSRGLLEPPSALAVELDIVCGDARGRARLLVPEAAVRALAGASEPRGAGEAISLPAALRCGSAPLSPEDAAALAPGDVVLLDAPPAAPDALVLPGGSRLNGRLEDRTFHVTEVTMKARTAELPVLLEVELARVEITVGELARLEPGAALPLAIDRRGVVTLRVGDRALGRGELVDVDGAVGVRVLTLEATP